MSIEPFNRLVKLATRAFYGDITTKGDNQPNTGRSNNRGIAVVVLNALTRLWSVMIFVFFYPRRQWVREEDLAKELKLHSKQLHQTLQFFSEEKLVTRGEVRTFVVFIFTRVLVSYCYYFCIFILCTFCSLTLFSAKLTIKV